MRYYDKEHLKGTIYDPESLAYRIANTPKSDHTELNRICEEVEAVLKIEREKERQLIREARERGEI